MRVLFTVSGWPAHWFPMVPLGWALGAAGHEVRVACPPAQAAAVASTGLTPVPILGDLDMAFQSRFANLWAARAGTWPYPWPPLHPVTGEPADLSTLDFEELAGQAKRRVAVESRRGFDAAVGYARKWRPNIVVHDRLSADGLLAALALGVPAVASLWGPVGTAETEPQLYPIPVDYTNTFGRYGVRPLTPEAMAHVLDPCPPALAPPVAGTRMPVRYVPYNGPGGAADLPPADRPRVCVVWSNSMSRMYGSAAYLVPTIVAALSTLDVEVVLPAHRDDVAALGPLPPGVRVLDQAPLHLLLPGCAAVVHHGGAGCAMTTAVAGLPQLMLPFGEEQDAIARRFAGTGAATNLAGHLATVDSIGAAVRDLLDKPAPRDAARQIADEMRAAPTPARLVADLVALAG